MKDGLLFMPRGCLYLHIWFQSPLYTPSLARIVQDKGSRILKRWDKLIVRYSVIGISLFTFVSLVCTCSLVRQLKNVIVSAWEFPLHLNPLYICKR